MKLKLFFWEKSSTIDLARLRKTQRRKDTNYPIRNETENISTEPTDIEKIIKINITILYTKFNN